MALRLEKLEERAAVCVGDKVSFYSDRENHTGFVACDGVGETKVNFAFTDDGSRL